MLRHAFVLLLASSPALLGAQLSQGRTLLMDTTATQAAVPAARQALRTLARLVTQENARSLGFNSAAEAAGATLGVPVQELMVRLDQLRAYTQEQSPMVLLRSNDRLVFPVLVGNATRSSLTVSREGSGWTTHSFGAPRYARELDGLRAELGQREALPANRYFEVRVPALNIAFLGRIRNGELFLTPITGDSRFGFQRGATLPARQAFVRMVAPARAHNGLPT